MDQASAATCTSASRTRYGHSAACPTPARPSRGPGTARSDAECRGRTMSGGPRGAVFCSLRLARRPMSRRSRSRCCCRIEAAVPAFSTRGVRPGPSALPPARPSVPTSLPGWPGYRQSSPQRGVEAGEQVRAQAGVCLAEDMAIEGKTNDLRGGGEGSGMQGAGSGGGSAPGFEPSPTSCLGERRDFRAAVGARNEILWVLERHSERIVEPICTGRSAPSSYHRYANLRLPTGASYVALPSGPLPSSQLPNPCQEQRGLLLCTIPVRGVSDR